MSRIPVMNLFLGCLVLLAWAPKILLGDLVERRAGGTAIEGDIRQIDQSGVQIRDANAVLHIVPWDRIRDVKMMYPDPRLNELLPIADELWRARTRLERGDRALAEPIFARMFAKTIGNNHETALMVAEGLLRVRLARGAHAAAVIPMLEVIRLQRAGIATDSFSTLPELFEEVNQGELLCVQLAPFFVRNNDLERLVKALDSYESLGDDYVERLAQIYKLAAEATLYNDGSTLESAQSRSQNFIEEAINIRWQTDAGGSKRSLRAVDELEERVDDLPSWARMWLLYALGMQKTQWSDLGGRDRGLVQLATVASVQSDQFAYLAGMALQSLADVLEEDGQLTAAASLRRELESQMPRHPIQQEIPPLQRAVIESEEPQEEPQ